MPSGFYTWSVTASINGNADSSINWQTGMSPSSVEPSSRAEMARLREWGNDISGAILTTGTATSYALASFQNFDTLAHLHGQMIAFTAHITNNATCTLNVDGLGAKPIRSAPSTEIGAGVLVQGTPYVVTYNNSDGAFYLQNFFGNPFNIPIGGLMPYIGGAAPNANFVVPFGQAISRTTYAGLFALTSTSYGPGDGLTTFNVPDLRGRAIFGTDNMGGAASNRITAAGGNFDATILGATGGAQNHTLTTPEIPSHSHTASVTDPGHTHGTTGWSNAGGAYHTAGGGDFAWGPESMSPATTGITVANAATGGGGTHTVLNPCMVLLYILRVI